TAHWNTARTVTVAAAEDDNTSSEAVTLTHTATSGSSTYSVGKSLEVTVIDNDTGTPDLALSPAALTVAEGGSATYTVRPVTKPAAQFLVTVSGGMDKGVSVDFHRRGGGGLYFTTRDWDRSQTVTVSAAPDDNTSPETVTLTHTVSRGRGYGSVRKELVVTVTDADTAGLVLSPAAVMVGEAGSATYTVSLATEPTEAVTVTMSGMGSGVSVDTDPGMEGEQASLSFTTADWNTPRTVTVSAAADDNAVSEEVTLSHTASGGNYDSLSKELAVTVTDNETVGLVLSPAALTMGEAGSATYTVKLAAEPTAAVRVRVRGMGMGMGSGISVDTD
ncbi:MAG: hypothetical protein TH68_06585, partial [Candidatus Synechococcus spongiarum 142]